MEGEEAPKNKLQKKCRQAMRVAMRGSFRRLGCVAIVVRRRRGYTIAPLGYSRSFRGNGNNKRREKRFDFGFCNSKEFFHRNTVRLNRIVIVRPG
jgi:hypothetical protein